MENWDDTLRRIHDEERTGEYFDDETPVTAETFIARYGLRMDVAPAPSNPNMDDMPEGSAHWAVTIHGPGGKLDIPYSMGPGHRRWKRGATPKAYKEFASQKVGGPAVKPYFGGCSLYAAEHFDRWTEPTPPDLPGVLECLSSDWAGVEGQTFEDWASDLGYDTDSRKAERVYRVTLETANIGRRVLGAEAFDVLTSGDIEW